MAVSHPKCLRSRSRARPLCGASGTRKLTTSVPQRFAHPWSDGAALRTPVVSRSDPGLADSGPHREHLSSMTTPWHRDSRAFRDGEPLLHATLYSVSVWDGSAPWLPTTRRTSMPRSLPLASAFARPEITTQGKRLLSALEQLSCGRPHGRLSRRADQRCERAVVVERKQNVSPGEGLVTIPSTYPLSGVARGPAGLPTSTRKASRGPDGWALSSLRSAR